jgi:L-threonylcarbamoyladenylate synthase
VVATGDSETAARCAAVLRAGGLVIVPTDTVYGICAHVEDDAAVRRISEAKGRGEGAPLQLLFGADTELLARYAVVNDPARRLVDALGPGGWTIISEARKGWSSPALAGGRTVGFRIPEAPFISGLVGLLEAPVAASSANRHGSPSPTTCAAAVADVGSACEIAVDGGPTVSGLDSTVIDCSNEVVTILREGAIDRDTVARILGLSDIPVLRSVRT